MKLTTRPHRGTARNSDRYSTCRQAGDLAAAAAIWLPPRRRSDLGITAAAAHKLNGAAQAVGAMGVANAAAALEQAGKAGDRTRCRDGLGPLAVELRRVRAEVEASSQPR